MITKIKPIDHFKDLVSAAIRHQKIKTNALAEFYLSTLLANFMVSQNLTEEPLAIGYLKALGEGRGFQARKMKQLGDLSLFISGFFSDSLKRKAVDIDYYILMGTSSYSYLAVIHGEDKTPYSAFSLFTELAGKFGSFVDVLTEVSEKSRLTSSRDILRVYERWLLTKSKQAERLLRDMGIEPLKISTKPLH